MKRKKNYSRIKEEILTLKLKNRRGRKKQETTTNLIDVHKNCVDCIHTCKQSPFVDIVSCHRQDRVDKKRKKDRSDILYMDEIQQRRI